MKSGQEVNLSLQKAVERPLLFGEAGLLDDQVSAVANRTYCQLKLILQLGPLPENRGLGFWKLWKFLK